MEDFRSRTFWGTGFLRRQEMKHKRILSAICSVSIVGGMIVLPVHGADTDIFSTDFTGSDYINAVADSKATAYRDQWLHYVMNVNAEKQPKT